MLNLSTVLTVAIADEILGSLSVCERLYDLLCRPGSGRMLGHIEMQHLATVVERADSKDASGTLTLTETLVPVSANASHNPVFFAATGELEGTVSGVAPEEERPDERQ